MYPKKKKKFKKKQRYKSKVYVDKERGITKQITEQEGQ